MIRTIQWGLVLAALAIGFGYNGPATAKQNFENKKSGQKWLDAKMTTLDADNKTFMVVENRTGGSGSGGENKSADVEKTRDIKFRFDPQKTNAHFKGEEHRLTWADIQVVHNLMQKDGQDRKVRIYYAGDKAIQDGETIDATEMVFDQPTTK